MSNHSGHHHHSHSEARGVKLSRNILAFLLFIVLLIFSISADTGLVFLNSERVSGIFTNEGYVSALMQDVLTYAHDTCDEAYIPYDSVDNTITYDAVYDIAVSYARGNLCRDDMYTDTTYQTKLEDLTASLNASTREMLDAYSLKADDASISEFSENITKYFGDKTEFAFIDYVKTATNFGRVASIVAGAASLIIAIILLLGIINTGTRKYRGIRAVAYSLTASYLFQAAMVILLEVLKKFKTFLVYPTYLCNSILSFVGKCEATVLLSAFITLVLSLVVMAFVWKTKRDEK